MEDKSKQLILWLDQITNDDVSIVGGKNASLGEMYTELVPQGIRIPNAFVVTAQAYRIFIEESGLAEVMHKYLDGLDTSNIKALQKSGKSIRKAFLKVKLPKELEEEIKKAYQDISKSYNVENVDVAVRSSATAEDLPGASFAGEHETFLNVSGADNVIQAIRAAMASLFTDRAISYRVDKGFDHFDVALSVGVQKMVRSDKGSSGVMFTLDTETGFRDIVQIDSSWGLGEMVVQGKVTPDEFVVFKPTLAEGYKSIVKKNLGAKKTKMVYQKKKSAPVKEVETTKEEQKTFTLSDDEIVNLARWAVLIEKHYTKRVGHPMPMDMEWAKDGITGELFIVQARPETVQAEKKGYEIDEYVLKEEGELIAEGISVGTKIVSGRARIILSSKKLDEFKEGEILVTEITDPDWEPIMKKAAAIITEKGGRTSHAAIVSRELGTPAVIGIGQTISKVKTGDMVTVDCSSGAVGKIYKGELKYEKSTHNLAEIPEVKTSLALNIGSPDGAFLHARLPHKGVGLAREEFIIASHIRIHPLALIHFDELAKKGRSLRRSGVERNDGKGATLEEQAQFPKELSEEMIKEIEEITVGYADKKEFYVEKLAEGIGQIAAAFWPHQVIVRFSDFKTNEYRALIGGSLYEPKEENPMIGWRGASRYAHKDFEPAFALECEAVKRVREKFGLKNLSTMIPFCRTPEEGREVLSVMEKYGLKKGEDDLKVYVMCEIPTNVVRADDFLDVFDGFSIGSNDLAQLTLGMDRDSALVAPISNENDPAVRALVSQAIQACKRRGKYIGFCGQAPSDYPDFLRFLINEGIDAVSLNPDSIIPMTFEVAKAEKEREI